MPEETSHFHDKMYFITAGGKECKVIMKKIFYLMIAATMMISCSREVFSLESNDSNDNNNEKVSEKIDEKVDDNYSSNDIIENSSQQEENNELGKSEDNNIESTMEPKLIYSTHIEDFGWLDYVENGEVSGTEKQAKRMEAIKINLISSAYQGGLSYSTHVEEIGWMKAVDNNQISGTEGKCKRLEAIKISLTGEIASYYDIYYRVHIQNIGWLDWACNGQPAGSQGYGYRVEAIQIKIEKKGELFSGATTNFFVVPGNVYYSTYVADKGWLSNVGDGTTGGIPGQGKSIEAIKIYINNALLDGNIEYSTHIEDIGWTDYVVNGAISGTVGKAKNMEAIKIRLTGDIADTHNIYYRGYIQNIGWFDWAKNDEVAGSEGFALRLEGIEIVILEKNGNPPGKTENPALLYGNINYSAHMQDYGWLDNVGNGEINGKIGQSKRMEALRISLGDNHINGNIEYSSHVQDIGWMDYVSNGEVSGTEGKCKRIEAIKIRLNGDIANYFDVYYRVYAQSFGWLGWTCNDQVAGTTNASFRLEAIQIKLYPKHTGPDVDRKSVINFIADGNYKLCQDAFGNVYTDAEPLLGKRSGYTIFTNLSTNIVNVFIADGIGREIITYKRYQCTSGAPSTPTIKGTFYIYMKRYYFDSGVSRCFYFSPFKGGYGFHSVLYYQDSTPQRIRDGRLGMYLSHGCIRLAVNNAKWIYDNCPVGTKVINL